LVRVRLVQLPVESITNAHQSVTVYNFRVSNYHTYFIAPRDAAFDVWVHNSCERYHKLAIQEAPERSELSIAGAARAGATRGIHEHHLFPQELASLFRKRGIDVHDYVVDVPSAIHGAIHGGGNWKLARQEWQNEWNTRILRELKTATQLKGSRLSPVEIEEIGIDMARFYGIGTDVHRYSRA
jgi:hypothetical protein